MVSSYSGVTDECSTEVDCDVEYTRPTLGPPQLVRLGGALVELGSYGYGEEYVITVEQMGSDVNLDY